MTSDGKTDIISNSFADMAQEVERILGKDEVTGSTPVISSIIPNAIAFGIFTFSLFLICSSIFFYIRFYLDLTCFDIKNLVFFT